MRSFAPKLKSTSAPSTPSPLLRGLSRTLDNGAPMLGQARPTVNELGHLHGQQADPEGTRTQIPSQGFDLSKLRISASPVPIQPQLTVNQPGDKYEQEADRMAEDVMRVPNFWASRVSLGGPPNVQKKCAACESGAGPCPKCAEEKEKKLQRKPLTWSLPSLVQREQAMPGSGQDSHITADLNTRVQALTSTGGMPLPESERAFFEPRLSFDFSPVRVLNDANAADLAQDLNARAFTIGNNIAFAPGQYAPGTDNGRRLIAHELTHVVQQNQSVHNMISRACLPSAACPTDSAGNLRVPGSASNFGEEQTDIEAPGRARRKRMTCSRALSTTHFGRARQLEIILQAADPALLSRIHGIFIDADISPKTGALVAECSDWETETLPAGCHPPATSGATKPCVFVPGILNQEALQFNSSAAPIIGGQDREDWHLSTIQTLIHEAQHVTFGAAISGRPEPAGAAATCPRSSVEDEVTEINAIMSEFPPVFRAVPVSPGPAQTQATNRLNDWFRHAITNPDESLSGTLKAMRCTCDCAEVNAHIRDIFDFVTASWTTAEKDAFNIELRNARWNVPPIDLNWPL